MRSASILRPYYYGEHKWDKYLLDINEAVESANAVAQEQTQELRLQTKQLRQIQDTLQTEFGEMRAEFHWGFTLLVDRMDRQIELVSQIAAKLDEIHKTLQSPLMTQARELFQVGQQRLSKGLLDKALEAFLQSEQKNEVDFLLQLQTGKLLLYGRDDDDNVIDLPQAERHLLLAARFADAEKSTIPNWNEFCGQAYFHAAVAAYLIGEQEHTAGRVDAMQACLTRALGHLAKAAGVWPDFLETVYTRAKCHALFGHRQELRQELEILSDRDRRYLAKATEDEDFDAFRNDVGEVFHQATVSPGPFARATQAKVDQVVTALEWAKRGRPQSKEDLADIESIESFVGKARQALGGVDVDLMDLNMRLDRTIQYLENAAESNLRRRIDASSVQLQANESKRCAWESSTQRVTAQMKETSGLEVGCLWAAVVYFGGSCLAGLLAFMVLGSKVDAGAVMTPICVVFMILAAIAVPIGSKISRNKKNELLRREVA